VPITRDLSSRARKMIINTVHCVTGITTLHRRSAFCAVDFGLLEHRHIAVYVASLRHIHDGAGRTIRKSQAIVAGRDSIRLQEEELLWSVSAAGFAKPRPPSPLRRSTRCVMQPGDESIDLQSAIIGMRAFLLLARLRATAVIVVMCPPWPASGLRSVCVVWSTKSLVLLLCPLCLLRLCVHTKRCLCGVGGLLFVWRCLRSI